MHWRFIEKPSLKLIYSFSIYSFLLHVFGTVILYTDAFVIGLFLPISFLTFFSIAGNLFTYARGLLAGVTQTITPLASKLEAEGLHKDLQRLTLNASGYATALMLPVYVTFMLRGSSTIGLWMGVEYAKLSGQVLWVLALAGVFSSAPAVAWAIMFGISKHKAMVPMYLVESGCNIGLSIWLVPKFGVIGSAWGTTLPNLLVCLFFFPWFVNRALGISKRSYIERAWIRPLISIMPFAACTYAMEHWWPAQRLFFLLIQVALALPLAAVPLWYVCVPREDRDHGLKNLKRSLGLTVHGA